MAQPKPAESAFSRGEMAIMFEWRLRTAPAHNEMPEKIRTWIDAEKRQALLTLRTAKGKGSADKIAYAEGTLKAIIRVENLLPAYAEAHKPRYFQWKDEGMV